MNIFATDPCPVQSAMWLDDKRIVKMILESAQMISFIIWKKHGKAGSDRYEGMYKARGVSFAKHPCTLWASRTQGNFTWLCDHAMAMCMIYEKVYSKVHASKSIIKSAYKFISSLPAGDLEEFVDCTEYKSPKFKHLSVNDRYRMFMRLKWNYRDSRKPTWRYRKQPEWR